MAKVFSARLIRQDLVTTSLGIVVLNDGLVVFCGRLLGGGPPKVDVRARDMFGVGCWEFTFVAVGALVELAMVIIPSFNAGADARSLTSLTSAVD